jgi:hypothetical protein
VKDALEKKGSYSTHLADRSLRLAYERETFERATTISSSQECVPDEGGLTFETRIDPHGTWSTELDVAIELLGASDDTAGEPTLAWQTRRPVTNLARNLERWLEDAPRLECDWEPLRTTYRRSLIDLAALRFSPISAGPPQPAGGRAAVVHDHVRARQHLDQSAGAAIQTRTRRDDAA